MLTYTTTRNQSGRKYPSGEIRWEPPTFTKRTLSSNGKSKVVKRPPTDGFRQPTEWTGYRYDYLWPEGSASGGYAKTHPWRGQVRIINGTVAPYDMGTPSGVWSGSELAFPSSIRELEIHALSKLTDGKISLGESLAESRSTLRMIGSTTAKAAGLALAIRKGKWNKARRILGLRGSHVSTSKRFADNYLEYSFGWSPLFSDIAASRDIFNEGIKRPQIFSVTASRSDSVDDNRPKSLPDVPPYRWWESDLARTIRVKLYASPSNEFLASLGTLGLNDPIGIAWALVPFSFVVDWILPIGDFLEATSAPLGLRFVGGTRSVKVIGSVSEHNLSFLDHSPRDELSGDLVNTLRFSGYTRKLYGTFPTPNPLYVKNPFSTSHAVTATALVRQLT